MIKNELLELIANGENSGVEFKRDDVHPDDLAKEISAFLNLEGGYILLGIEDDGEISGLTRDKKEVEEWIMNVCRNNIQPPVIPYWESVAIDQSKNIGIISLPDDSPDKPYKARRGNAWVTFVRVGSTSREATRDEEARLFQASGLLRYDIKPVPGSSYDELEARRVENYFKDILLQETPPRDETDSWRLILTNMDFLTESGGKLYATVGGLLLFGTNPNKYLPQAGITATAFSGTEKDYDTADEEVIRGPLVSVISQRGEILEKGVIDLAVDFAMRNMGTSARLVEGRRERKKSYPVEAVRESIINAVAHRDYTIYVTDIELSLYSDRLEVISPGRLPNTVTVEKMKQGYRAARNELLKEVLRDYGYVEHRGMGVRNKIIKSMIQHNGTEPGLVEEEDRFKVVLWKEREG